MTSSKNCSNLGSTLKKKRRKQMATMSEKALIALGSIAVLDGITQVALKEQKDEEGDLKDLKAYESFHTSVSAIVSQVGE